MASPFQFSVRQLLIAVAFLAVGIVALRNANSYWMSAIWGAVPLLLAVAILLVIFRRGQSQAFWIGFALFGCLYGGLVLLAYWPSNNSPGHFPLAYYQLWTTRLTDWTYVKMIPEAQRQSQIPNPAAKPITMPGMGGMMPGSFGPGMGGMDPMGGFVPLMANPDYVDGPTFQQIGHALWLVILAAIGGKLAQWIYKTGVRDQGTGVSGR